MLKAPTEALRRWLTRRRLATAIVLFAVLSNVYVDYRLFLRNPRELEAQAKRFLRAALPGYTAQFGARTEFNFFTGRLRLFDVRFHKQGRPSDVLFEVKEMTVASDGLIPTQLVIKVQSPVAHLEIDREGNLVGLGPSDKEQEEPTTSLPLDLEIEIEDGYLTLKNDFEGMGAEVLVSRIQTVPERRLRIRRDLSCEGALSLYLASMVPRAPGSPPQDIPGLPAARSAETVLPQLTVEVARSAGGPLGVVAHGTVEISRSIRALIPPVFQQEVWDELNPLRGEAQVSARVTQLGEQINVDLSLTPHGVAMLPKGFPVELVEIEGGRFEISVALAEGDMRFLGVSWEELKAKIRGETRGAPGLGNLTSRGSVYPGRDHESLTLGIDVVVRDLPLAPHLVDAFPLKIREVYDEFGPEGVIPEAYVSISKSAEERDRLYFSNGRVLRGLLDPQARLVADARGDLRPDPVQPLSRGLDAAIRFVDYRRREYLVPVREVARVEQNSDPQISIWVPRLDGKVSARYRRVPERLEAIQGWFELREGANVELHAEGRLEHGGEATVDAQVMHGDLISVHVQAARVPVSEHLIAAMPGQSKLMIQPFRLEGGEIDVDVEVSKPRGDAPALPVVRARLRDVGFDHEQASIALVASGSLEIRPIFATEAQEDPDRIDVGLDLSLAGEGVVAALVSGTLTLPPRQPPEGIAFDSDLRAKIDAVDVSYLPPLIRDLLDSVRPQGQARGVEAHVRGPDRLWVSGVGAGLAVQPRAFDIPFAVQRFHVEVADGRVQLHEVEARRLLEGLARGGPLRTTGWIGLNAAEGETPPLSFAVELEDCPLEASLIAALPPATREALGKLAPRGAVSGALQLLLAPGRSPELQGRLQISQGEVWLHRINEGLAQLRDTPLTDLSGQIVLEPERVRFRELQGRLAGAELSMSQGELQLVEGELVGFDLPAELRGLQVDARTRALAGPATADFFETFYVEGPADLSLRTFKRGLEDEVHVHVEARPRGALARAAFAPLPVTGLTGMARVEDGEAVAIDLTGYLSPPTLTGGTGPADLDSTRIRIRRDVSQEGAFPQGGAAGRVFRVSVTDFRRYPRVEGPDAPNSLRERFEAELPSAWRETLDAFEPGGAYDVEAWFYQPTDPREAMRWIAETRFREAALTLARFEDAPRPRPGERPAGIGFTDLSGVLRLKGRLAELELGSCSGELYLTRADFFKQTFKDLRGPFQVEGGRLSFGVPGRPFRARLYDGDFLGRADYDFRDGAYACEFALGLGRDQRPGRLAETLSELKRLSDDPEEDKGSFAFRGRLRARLSCGGGGRDLAGRQRPFGGRGELRLEGSNLLDTPFLKTLQTVVAKVRGSDESEPLPNLALDFRMDADGMRIRSADLWGRDLKVHGEDGVFRYDGFIDIDVVPFNTSGGLHQILKWVPGTGYRYRGSFSDEGGPSISPYLNPLSTIDWLRDLWQPGDKE